MSDVALTGNSSTERAEEACSSMSDQAKIYSLDASCGPAIPLSSQLMKEYRT
jgi:hypothetical protein